MTYIWVMDVARPFTAISSGVDVDLLVVMAGSTAPRSGRDLARRAGRSNTAVQRVLERLVAHGLVHRVEVGRTYLYTLNRDHLLAPVVELMAATRTTLVERLRSAFYAWEIEPVRAMLFGSAARGDGDENSDIDLFVVRPGGVDVDDHAWRSQLDLLSESVLAWTGNNASVAEISESDLASLQSDRSSIAEELERDAIDLRDRPRKY